MDVSNVRTESGALVNLRFAGDRVEVREISPARQRALRACAGGLLLGTGLAAVAANAGLFGIRGLPVVLWIVAAAVLAGGVVGGGLWWLVVSRRDGRRGVSTIEASSVVNARSRAENGLVTVALELADSPDREFSAVGHAGTQLSARFGEVLSAT
ncbi:hypothetical protein KOI35_10660 [Actinoplanes bogorensis]|uniref:Uncharacterized protein n=1 Tax=Paractinoplanes bogorensis TaxID=1610840 RepID=A0ABS5YLN0_9ACTN|nr:hypothetical protein [Actinoplanes bogorensis]MBU2663951.1 hypothetical protein [Actinoplanes bogorensis]